MPFMLDRIERLLCLQTEDVTKSLKQVWNDNILVTSVIFSLNPMATLLQGDPSRAYTLQR